MGVALNILVSFWKNCSPFDSLANHGRSWGHLRKCFYLDRGYLSFCVVQRYGRVCRKSELGSKVKPFICDMFYVPHVFKHRTRICCRLELKVKVLILQMWHDENGWIIRLPSHPTDALNQNTTYYWGKKWTWLPLQNAKNQCLIAMIWWYYVILLSGQGLLLRGGGRDIARWPCILQAIGWRGCQCCNPPTSRAEGQNSTEQPLARMLHTKLLLV